MKIAISVNTTWNLVNFRSNLIKSFISSGHEVIAISPPDEYIPVLVELGCSYIPLQIDNKGNNPIKDMSLFFQYLKFFYINRPDIYLGYTIKPNIFGTLAASLFKIPVINNITGLGTVFILDNWLARIVELLYKFALKKSDFVFFQNHEDRDFFYKKNIINLNMQDGKKTNIELLPGSGVDLSYFFPIDSVVKEKKNTLKEKIFVFLFMGRLLKDKGFWEFVDAAKIIKVTRKNVRFCVLGFIDTNNPTAISSADLNAVIEVGLIEYLGFSDDVRSFINLSDCVVLPSYREGTPRALLEAAAMERPIIASDVAGCRDVVDDGVNGFLCNPYDAKDLAFKMKKLMELDPLERRQMGLMGRKKIESEFDELIIIKKYHKALKKIKFNH